MRHEVTDDAGEGFRKPGPPPTRAQLTALANAIHGSQLPAAPTPFTEEQIAALTQQVQNPSETDLVTLQNARVFNVTVDSRPFAVVVSKDGTFVWLGYQMGSYGVSDKWSHTSFVEQFEPDSAIVVRLLALVAWPTSVPLNEEDPALPSENGPDADGPGQGQPPANLTVYVMPPMMADDFVKKVRVDAQHINQLMA